MEDTDDAHTAALALRTLIATENPKGDITAATAATEDAAALPKPRKVFLKTFRKEKQIEGPRRAQEEETQA